MLADRVDELAKQAQGGDRRALAELWQALAPHLQPHLRRFRAKSAEGPLEPGDLEQQLYLVLVDVVRSWRGEGPFLAWCHKLVPKRLLSYRLSVLGWGKLRVVSLSPEDLAKLDEEPVAPAGGPDPADVACCRQLLAQLAPSYRRLLGWRYWEELTFRDIERLHGLPAASAQVECARAVAWLGALARGEQPPPLRPLSLPADVAVTRPRPDLVRSLWALADAEGVLPPAGEARRALGLGARAYAGLVAALRDCCCLGTAGGAAFASHRGRRSRVLVPVHEALRLASDAGSSNSGWQRQWTS
ncbi:MAG: hypothetical protein M1401_16845 [Chloroflexi bacterium]|nr:hypothetical protein [Chloroflexota bacterium]